MFFQMKKLKVNMPDLPLPPSPMGMDAEKIYSRDPLGTLSTMASFGDVISFRLSGKPLVLVNHPDLVKEVLVNQAKVFGHAKGLHRMRFDLGEGLLTSSGEDYQAHRRMSQRAFRASKILEYETVVNRIVKKAVLSVSQPQRVNLSKMMMEITLTILGKTLFSFNMEDHNKIIVDAMSHLVNMNFDEEGTLEAPQITKARIELDASIHQLLSEREKKADVQNDLFDELKEFFKENPERTKRIRDSVLTMILAGHETTASVLAWSWSCLHKNPDVLQKVQTECRTSSIAEVIGTETLSWTQAVLSEVMRLYPPVWLTGRRASSDTVLGGFMIPRNTTVIMSQFLIQRDKRSFDSPELFRPERWLFNHNVTRFNYFPFGVGHRKCIGADLAWMEASSILAHALKYWDVSFVSQPVKNKQVGITMRPQEDILAIVKPPTMRKTINEKNMWTTLYDLRGITPKWLWEDDGFQSAKRFLANLPIEFKAHPFAFEQDLTVQNNAKSASLTMGFPVESLWVHKDNEKALWPLFIEACGGVDVAVDEVAKIFREDKGSFLRVMRRFFCAVEINPEGTFSINGFVATFRDPPIINDATNQLVQAYEKISPTGFMPNSKDLLLLENLFGKHKMEHIGVPTVEQGNLFKAYPMGLLDSLIRVLPVKIQKEFFSHNRDEVLGLVADLAKHQTNLVLDIQDGELKRIGIELKLRHQKQRKPSAEIEAIFKNGFVRRTLEKKRLLGLQQFIEPQQVDINNAMSLALNHLKVSFKPGGAIQWKAYWVYLSQMRRS